MGVNGQRHAALLREKTHCTEVWVGAGPVWTGEENLTPTGILFPDRPNASVVTTF